MTFQAEVTRPAIGGGDDFRVQLRQRLRILWRSKALVIGCVLLGLVPTVLYLIQATPLYTAEVKLMVEGPEASEMLMLDRTMPVRQSPSEALVTTEADILQSNMLLRRLIDRLHLAGDPEFNRRLREPKPLELVLTWINPVAWLAEFTPGDKAGLSAESLADMERARVATVLRNQLKVQSQRRSFVISAQFSSEGREKARLIANTLAELYLDDRLEASFENSRRITAWLGERLENLRRDVATAEAAAEQYRSLYNLRRKGDRQATVTDQQMSELNSRLIIARTELAQKQAKLDQARSLIRTHGTVETAADVLQSQLIQKLREQETTLLRAISEAAKNYGDRHPKIVGYQADLVQLRSKIGDEVRKYADSIANEVEVAATGVNTLQRALDGLRGQTNLAGEAEVKLRELERQAEVSRALYESFLSRFKRDSDQERVQRANARVISPASIPTSASSPHKFAALVTAFLISLTLGIALVFILDRLDNAVRSADEAEELTGLSTLAVIPIHHGASDNLIQDLADRPRSALADSIRSLRVTLNLGDAAAPVRTIMVTSSMPKEGKTFVAQSLAAALARVEKRVLLIDGDLHRPRLQAALRVEGDLGLAQVLAGLARFEDAVVREIAPGLDFLSAGNFKGVADLVNIPSIEVLLAGLTPLYDRIVIDLPPVLALADPRIFTGFADRVVYVVKWNSTPRDAIRSGLKLLQEADVAVHGLVLSQVDQRKYARYAYGDYGNYYGRYKEYYGE
ncbi:Protein-tyrosine kinase [Candidatus Terasakiella magnetica]|nr:Protein-tyrosine kinase [Candidatus Terasakiella magnetica]